MDGVNELVERLAREAIPLWMPQRGGFADVRDLRRFAALVAEEIARVVEEEEPGVGLGNHIRSMFQAMK